MTNSVTRAARRGRCGPSAGYGYHSTGSPDALHHLQASVRLFGQLHMPLGQARGLMVLGDAYLAKDDHLAACRSWERALSLFQQLGVPEADQVRDRLAENPSGRAARSRLEP